jgi:hypothetical protein
MKLSRVLIAVIACASFLVAQEAAAPAAASAPEAKAAPAAKKAAATTISGTVVSADASTIIVKTKKGEDTLAIDAAAKIMIGKKEAVATDLKADMKVTVTCKVVDGKKVATKIAEKAAVAGKVEKKTVESTTTTTTTTEPAAAPATTPAAAPAATPAAAPAAEKKPATPAKK